MISNIAKYTIPALGALCAVGAVSVVMAIRAPVEVDVMAAEDSAYNPRVPQNLELENEIPTMEEVVEKHLFVKERKATGANTFPDLLVKGVYVGTQQNAVFSLKSSPSVNLRVWFGDVDSSISQVTESRDPRQSIVNFLNEWEIKEITFKGVTVEHFVTGEVETYEVDYTPAKHVKDNAESGYGQGALAEVTEGGKATKTVAKTTQTKAQPAQGLMMNQLKNMVQQMSPEQRARMADRIRGGGGGGGQTRDNQQNDNQQTDRRNSNNSGSRTSTNRGR